MISVGLDVGSRTIVLVELAEDKLAFEIADTGANPLARCKAMLGRREYHRLVATGYGRHLLDGEASEIISEIKAYALGGTFLYPDCRTVIDVGGQDSKAILVGQQKHVQKFQMNDRCAAGTGRFLEVMARALELDISALGPHALSAERAAKVNSTCTVFAESEVISLIARGEDSRAIALGVHESIATRIVAMVQRVGPQERVVFAGGGALNPCLVQLLGTKLKIDLTVPPNPQIVGALGAALS